MSLGFKKMVLVVSAFLSAGLMVATSGCASGGYSISRSFAGWINKNNILLRIVLYIFLGGAFLFTLVADLLVMNTIDFWTGKVSQGTYEFKDAEKTFVVKHSLQGDLHQTHIEIKNSQGKKLQDILMKETARLEVEYYLDGVLKAKFDNIESVPRVTQFDRKGRIFKQENLPEYADRKIAAQ